MLSTFGDEPLKKQVDAPGDDAGVVLVLLHIPQEGHLLFFVIIAGRLAANYVVPIASEHGVRLAASSLPIGEQRNVVPFHGLEQKRLDDVEDLSLRGLGGQCKLYFLVAAESSDFDLESGLIYEGGT